MKKFTLLLFFLFSLSGYCQFPENFEGSTNLPANWHQYVTSTVAGEPQNQWSISSGTGTYCFGTKAAVILPEGLTVGATAKYFLVTPLFKVPDNGQVRFSAKQGKPGDQGSTLQVMVSTDSNPANLSSYIGVAEWTETDLGDTSTLTCHELKATIGLPGQQVYLAFVKVFTQSDDESVQGDRWSVDDVNVVSQCMDPTAGLAIPASIAATTATLDWTDATGTLWDIELVSAGNAPTGNPTDPGVTKPYPATGLTPDKAYDFYVRSACSDTNKSGWAGPFSFKTYPIGVLCTGAIPVTTLPYQTAANTANFQDLVDTLQNASVLCGATPATTNYMDGNDVFYSYTADKTGLVSIKLTPTGPNSSVFVYSGCPTTGPCLAGVANSATTQRVINNFPVTAGQTYIIVVSSAKVTQTVGYTLIIQREPCTPPVGSTPIGADLTTTSAKLSWTNPTAATSWDYVVQPLGNSIPSPSDAVTTVNDALAPATVSTIATKLADGTSLTAGTQYQYYVRSKCPDGDFSSWAGPYAFNTVICEDANKCLYTFVMTDSGANGWNGATMQVRQGGIVVQSIGSTFTGGAGPVPVKVGLCKDLPFDLFWDTPGLKPAECGVSVVNSFGQTLFTKAPGQLAAGQIVYNNTVNCTAPVCDIAPSSLNAASIDAHGATLSWAAPATTAWDVYVVPEGSAAPIQATTPTYKAVTTNPFAITGLLADTCYDYYVRVVCSPNPSAWSAVYNFCTLPTCPRPTGLSVPALSTPPITTPPTPPVALITKTGATLYWEPGTPADTQWEVLLVKAVGPDYAVPPTPSATYFPAAGDKLYSPTSAIPSTASPFVVNDLETATIYYYYVRTLCPGNDKSVWSGPIKFNTVTCDAANKCNYSFIMTDAGNNGWETGRMQIRQNGIVVSGGTIGAGITNGGPVVVTVSLCTNVPFDLVWTVAGAKPAEIGVKVVSPFGDLIYTKLPGDGIPPVAGGPADVLFASTGNCTPPTCVKPKELTVNNITATAADLGWTESNGATEWEVYAVPAGTAAPANTDPVSGVKPYYKATSNPFHITGLDPSTTYEFYVRSICSGTDKSTWDLLNPKKFMTPPVNDDCGNSIVVPVNDGIDCVVKASGNTKGATASVPATNPVCQGFADDDVWFSFVAKSTIHVIDINNIAGGTTDLNHTVYAGTDCATQTQLYCSNPNTSVATNLTVGNTYRIRVYTNGMDLSQTATFDVCITTPAPIVNDECDKAVTLDVNVDLTCGQSTPGTLTGASGSLPASTCIGTADDDVWYKFVATTLNHYIYLNNVAGTSIDVNHAVYTGDCNNLVLKYCSVGNSLNSNAKDFVPGQTYYVRVWSNSATPQKIDFKMCIGSVPPPVITSTSKYTTKQLIEDVLLGTKCANVTNIKSSTGTNFSSVNGIGYFDKSLSGFPFKDGIVMSSGNALSVPGPNGSNALSEGSSAWPGDPDLEKIVTQATGNPPNNKNASVLEFDFTPLSEKLSFNFLFASEEYGTFQCSFSDAFAFLLTDSAGKTTNLALIPGTSLPISVVTIRNKAYNNGCPSNNENYFGQYYGTNGGGLPAIGAPINFNGLTVPMKAETDGLTPGAKYHIKLVIADRMDTAYDSAVFLEGGSFNIGDVDLGVDLLKATKNALCFGEKHVISSGLDATKYTFVWKKNDEVIKDQTAANLGITTAGTYTVEAHYLGGACDATDSVVIEYYDDVAAGTPKDMTVCDASGVAVFDFTENSALILSPFNGDHTVAYYTSSADANAQINAIANTSAFQNTVTPQTIYARVNETGNKCFQIVTFKLTVQDLTPKFTLSGDMKLCPTETTTISVVPTDNNFDPTKVTYTWAYIGNVLPNETGSSITLTGTGAVGLYTVTVDNTGCIASMDFEVTTDTDPINIDIESGCSLNDYKLTAVPLDGSFDPATVTYDWTAVNGATFKTTDEKNTIIVTSIGTYNVKVTTADGCSADQSITVNDISCIIQKGISPGSGTGNASFDLTTLKAKRLEIFNRWGAEVYSLDNYTNEWHGQSTSGSDLPDGTYFYQIHFKDNKKTTGWVYITRKQ